MSITYLWIQQVEYNSLVVGSMVKNKSICMIKSRLQWNSFLSILYSDGIVYFYVGFSTDGEFNSFRASGLQRPISITEVIKNAKQSAKSMKAAVVSKCFALNIQGTVDLQIEESWIFYKLANKNMYAKH